MANDKEKPKREKNWNRTGKQKGHDKDHMKKIGFQKGEVNYEGAPKVPEDLKGIMLINGTIIRHAISKLSMMTLQELKEHIADPTTPSLTAAIAMIWASAIQKGDHAAMEWLIQRTAGKVPDVIDLTLKPEVVFDTKVTGDGRLLQDILLDEFGGK